MRPYNSLATLVPLLISLAFAPSVFDTINREAPADEGPKYSVQLMTGAIHPPGVAVPPKSVVMTKKDGKRYRCYLPSEGGAPSAADESLAAPTPHIATYLRALKGTCFYRLEGWWTYEFCLLKAVRQFHQEKVKTASRADATTITQDYTLGEYWVPPKAAPPRPPPPRGGDHRRRGGRGRGRGAAVGRRLPRRDARRPEDEAEVLAAVLRQRHHVRPQREAARVGGAAPLRAGRAVVPRERRGGGDLQVFVQFSSNLLCKHPAFAASKKKDAVENVQCEPLDATGAPMPAPKRAPPTPPTTRRRRRKGAGPRGRGGGGGGRRRGRRGAGPRRRAAVGAAPLRGGGGGADAAGVRLGAVPRPHKYSYRGVIVGYHPRGAGRARRGSGRWTSTASSTGASSRSTTCSPTRATGRARRSPTSRRRTSCPTSRRSRCSTRWSPRCLGASTPRRGATCPATGCARSTRCPSRRRRPRRRRRRDGGGGRGCGGRGGGGAGGGGGARGGGDGAHRRRGGNDRRGGGNRSRLDYGFESRRRRPRAPPTSQIRAEECHR